MQPDDGQGHPDENDNPRRGRCPFAVHAAEADGEDPEATAARHAGQWRRGSDERRQAEAADQVAEATRAGVRRGKKENTGRGAKPRGADRRPGDQQDSAETGELVDREFRKLAGERRENADRAGRNARLQRAKVARNARIIPLCPS